MYKLAIAICLSLVSVSAFAAGGGTASAGGPAGNGGNDSDGCGLGWQVTQGKTFVATTTRGTTNSVVHPTYGMTSGTMGCAQHQIAKNEEAAATYAVNNYETLSIEMAQGQGEYLQAFARTLGCDDSAQGAFGQMTQKNYKNLLEGNKGSALNLYKNVKSQVKQDAVLAAACNAV